MTQASVSIRGIWAFGFTMLFVYHKLTDQIDWNWIIVLAPAWTRVLMIQGYSILAARRVGKAQTAEVEPQTTSPTGFFI